VARRATRGRRSQRNRSALQTEGAPARLAANPRRNLLRLAAIEVSSEVPVTEKKRPRVAQAGITAPASSRQMHRSSPRWKSCSGGIAAR
jgi:hypothetical protein